MSAIDLLGFIAACLTTFAFLPQFLKVRQTRSTKDISLPMLITFIAGISLWFIYGIFIGSLPVILANIITLVLNLLILRYKLRYG